MTWYTKLEGGDLSNTDGQLEHRGFHTFLCPFESSVCFLVDFANWLLLSNSQALLNSEPAQLSSYLLVDEEELDAGCFKFTVYTTDTILQKE